MQTTKRQLFLENYLGLLGADSIIWTKFETDKIYGTVIYDPNDSEERQDFCWHQTEESVPSEKVIELIKVLKNHKLIDIDKLILPLEEVFKLTGKTNFEEFVATMDELFEVGVRMVDDGEETDCYFIHD